MRNAGSAVISEAKTLLVVMPWASLHRPSLGTGILAAAAERAGLGRVDQLYASLEWARYLMEKSGGQITPEAYTHVAERYFAGAGEWVFAAALHGEPSWQVEQFTAYTKTSTDLDPDLLVRMQGLASGFVDEMCARIAARDYEVIGLSTTFMQNVPSLALAKRIRQSGIDATLVFGGGNCDGEQGEALHRNFPFVDVVVRGEADTAFPRLLAALRRPRGEAERLFRQIPGLCWRLPNGQPVANPVLSKTVSLRQGHAPAYEDYFSALARTGIDAWVEPELVLEASRGCWWGEKHQCTFCGLNGSAIGFRSKPQGEFLDELAAAVGKYRVLDVTLADNILDMKYFNDFVPALAAQGWDLRIHCEVKANLTEAHVRSLRTAGVVNLQPGIESLSSRVLKLMDKGITATRNVRLLRDCGRQGITVEWNWLYGFPGEDEADYRAVLDQLPAMVHLQPPSGAFRIALERFSPYFERPELGLVNRGPAAIYSMIYDLPAHELAELVYLFDSVPGGIHGETEIALQQAVAAWESSYPGSTLTYSLTSEGVAIHDRRRGWPQRDLVLPYSGKAEVYLALAKDRTPAAVLGSVRAAGFVVSDEELSLWLAEFVAQGLVFVENNRYLALAVPAAHPDGVLTGDELGMLVSEASHV